MVLYYNHLWFFHYIFLN